MNAISAVPSAYLNQSLDQFKRGLSSVDQIPTSSYRIPDFRSETQVLRDGVNHLKLDDTFISNCPAWRNNFPQRKLANERAETISLADSGSQFTRTYGSTMGPNSLNTLQENQLHDQGQWAKNNFNQLNSAMKPLAGSSYNRVNQFCDWIGVTDRYTGYRNNLTRSNQGYATYGPPKAYPEMGNARSNTRFNLRQTSAPLRCFEPSTSVKESVPNRSKTAHHKSIQEQCGIVTTYPGESEYRDRYLAPKNSALDYHYKVNPIPDFSIIGRPIQPSPKDDLRSVYTVSYDWPSAAKYPKLPWLKR